MTPKASPLASGLTDARSGAQAQTHVVEWGLFEIPADGEWAPGDPALGEPDRMPKMEGCRPVHYFRATKEYKANATPRPVTLWHSRMFDGPADDREAAKAAFADTGEWAAPFGPEDWVLGRFDRQAGRWEIVDAVGKSGVRIALTGGGGIAANGSATVTELNMDGTTRENAEEDPITFTAYNCFTSAIGGDRRIYTLPWRHNATKEIAIAEDCPS